MEQSVEITLVEARLAEGPRYEALSYTWAMEDGDVSLSSQIRCNGGRIWVTKTCELALRYLRKSDSSRVLWVDAICINQKDADERGHQVGIMRDVYSKAAEVVVWLGETSADLDTDPPPSNELQPSDSTSGMAPDTSRAREISNDKNVPTVLGPFSSVSEIFLQFFCGVVVEIRLLRIRNQDPKASPTYQRLLQHMSVGYGTSVRSGLIRFRYHGTSLVVSYLGSSRNSTRSFCHRFVFKALREI